MNRRINITMNYATLIVICICLGSCATAPDEEQKKKGPSHLDSVSLDKEAADSNSDLIIQVPKGDVQLRLNSIILDKKAFNPSSGESVNIRYHPSRSSFATVTICDSWGVPVRVLVDSQPVSPSPEIIEWDGLDEKDQVVPAGVYFYVVELKDGETNYVYNPYRRSHGKTIRSVTGYYDQVKGEIHYTLPQAAQVRIRVGLKEGGPLLNTILDWTPKPAGKYLMKWDGKDASGHINIAYHPERNLVIFAYSLADNSIIVDSEKESLRKRQTDISALFPPELPLDRDRHAMNYLKMDHEPRIDVEFLVDFAKIEDAIPIVKGVVPVKVSIAPEDKLAMENSRYEIMFYVDTVFLFEEESGFSPFTYMWDTSSLPEGEHLLTVNLWSYDDNCGVVTKKVFVRKE